MDIDTQRRIAAILRILDAEGKPLGSHRIAEAMKECGIDIKERMVRYYLEETDRRGFTMNNGRLGRELTKRGKSELADTVAVDRLGTLPGRLLELAYRATFNLHEQVGTVAVNRCRVAAEKKNEALAVMRSVVEAGWGMGRWVCFHDDGKDGGAVEHRMTPIGVLSEVTVDGVLRSHGIPVTPVLTGLLAVENRKPKRFSETIQLNGVTVEPMSLFSKAMMTQVTGVVESGCGIVGATFREIPSAVVSKAKEVVSRLERIGICSVVSIEEWGREQFDIPLRPDRAALILPASLNCFAALKEHGFVVEDIEEMGIEPFERCVDLFNLL